VFLSSINGMPGALLPPLLDLFGEPLRLPTRRERQRVALQARRPAAPAPSAAPTSPRVEPAPAAVATPAPPDAVHNAALPHPRLWRASELGQGATPVQPSGYRLLDAELPGGGWPLQGLIELLLPFPGSVEWRLLAPALRPLLTPPPASGLPERQLLLIGPPQAPHPRGLLPWGIGARHCLWVAPGNGPGHGRERLWTLEQALRADPPELAAVLAWLPQPVRPEQLRRLQSLAAHCHCLVFVMRPSLDAQASTPAPLRLRVAPGAHWAQLELQLLKRRGPPREAPLWLHAPPPALQAVLPLAETAGATAPPRTRRRRTPSP